MAVGNISIAHTPCKRTSHEVHEGERPSQRPHRQRHASFLSPASETFQATAHVSSSTLPSQPIVSQRPPVGRSISTAGTVHVSPYHLMHPLPPFACRRFPLYRCRLQVGVQEIGHSACMMKGPHNGAEDKLLMCHYAHHHQKYVTHLHTVPHLCHRCFIIIQRPLLPHPQHQLMLAEHHFDIELT